MYQLFGMFVTLVFASVGGSLGGELVYWAGWWMRAPRAGGQEEGRGILCLVHRLASAKILSEHRPVPVRRQHGSVLCEAAPCIGKEGLCAGFLVLLSSATRGQSNPSCQFRHLLWAAADRK